MILLFVLLILCGILIALIRLSTWRRNCSLLMPGSRPNFFNPLGDATHFLDFSTSMDHRFAKVMADSFNKYGNMSLYCLWMLYEPFVIFCKVDAMKELLKGPTIEKSWIYDFTKVLFGNGLLTSGGAKWKSRRKLLNSCFHHDILKDFQSVFDEHAQKLADFFQGETEKDFTYVDKPLKLSTLDMICETICGLPIGAFENQNQQYVKAVSRLSELFIARVCNFFLWPDFIFKYTRLSKEQTHHLKVLQDFSRSVIQKKKSQYQSRGENNSDKGKRKALMDMLLDRHFNFQDFDEEDIREEVDTFIMEGHDTVAVCLMWTLFLIGHHPDVQSKLHAELYRTFGKDVDTSISVNDLNQLDYMECVIKESNRIYTIVPVYGRQFYEDTKICGYTIPKGSSGMVLSYYLHRDETIFPDPEKFDPDRFLPENEINIPDFAYIPFSAGPRNCIGKTFAMMEMKTILAAILRRFELHSLDGKDKVLPMMQITLNPSIPIRIRFRYRQ